MPKNTYYTLQLKRIISSQYIYAGVRIALAVVFPSVVFAYLGILKDYFLFPLGTSLMGFADMAGPFVKRRNTMVFSIISFSFVAFIASLLKDYPVLIFFEIIVFGIFFTMLGIYGLRLAAVGGMTLVVFSIFMDGHLIHGHVWYSVLIFTAGCIWFLLVFLVSLKLQPYKLSGQMIGQNYLQLGIYLRTKARFYAQNSNFEDLYRQMIAQQVVLKNLQEDTREVVFKTRMIVKESTAVGRLLMQMFLSSIDLFDKLMATDINDEKVNHKFGKEPVLEAVHQFLIRLSEELENLGVALQSGTKVSPKMDIESEIKSIHNLYFELRNTEISTCRQVDFMALRVVLSRTKKVANSVAHIYKIYSQDLNLVKSLSSGLDFDKFVPKQEKLNYKVFLNNFSLKSIHFRHAVRITTALFIAYGLSKWFFLGIGHPYWILITILAIMRPAYSTTKYRNILRIYGTISGGIAAYVILNFIDNDRILLGILLISMILCFSMLNRQYSWAVFFMTIYIFIGFNFLSPGNVNLIFKDRILDTFIAGVIVFVVSYFVLPIWEHSHNLSFMKKSVQANLMYFEEVIKALQNPDSINDEVFRMKRKEAVISLANLSDHFQRMLSDPKNQREKLETVHQFVTTSHLITAYTASLSQYIQPQVSFDEMDWEGWRLKITSRLNHTLIILNDENPLHKYMEVIPKDEVLLHHKNGINTPRFEEVQDSEYFAKLTEFNALKELLGFISDVGQEQSKVAVNYKKMS